MSSALPKSVDAWRMVSARRVFEGSLRLDSMPRLAESLVDAAGECRYVVGFGDDGMGLAFLDVELEAVLPLTCQRTLERFELPVAVNQRLGLIRDELDEAMLPEDYEAVLVADDGLLSIADMIEDELILAIPVVPMSNIGLLQGDVVWEDAEDTSDSPESPSPFAALADLKKSQ